MKSKVFLTTVGELLGFEQYDDSCKSGPIILSENNKVYPNLMVRPLPIPVNQAYSPVFGSASYISGLVDGFPHLPIIVRKVYLDGDTKPDYILLSSETRIMTVLQFLNDEFTAIITNKVLKWSEMSADQVDDFYQIQIPVYEVEGDDMELYNFMKDPIIVPARFGSYNSLNNAIFYGNLLQELHALMNDKSERTNIWKEFNVTNSCFGYDWVYTALSYISHGNVARYLREHKDDSAMPVYKYFNDVIDWVISLFGLPKYAMHVEWADLYEKYHENTYEVEKLQKKVDELFANSLVENRAGIYEFVLSGETNTGFLCFDV